ncbi:hypothetical protein [Mesorhizobium sp. WSM4884]|uniref:hypothetical protein n=1 Tax=Mesorhizobium sp. WSM4884 TaxID=3038542 RepID=UPI0024165010|nr:hypothetical protein [Mesorhizobium sp. WSM4884]MDG4881931.1 hypothetical protein [Mesorhizobium sp. WSM4884]
MNTLDKLAFNTSQLKMNIATVAPAMIAVTAHPRTRCPNVARKRPISCLRDAITIIAAMMGTDASVSAVEEPLHEVDSNPTTATV